GSSTIPPGGVTNRTSHAISSVGLTVGCVLRFKISSPRQSLFRSFFDAFFDNSGGVILKYLLKKASGSVVTQFAGKRPSTGRGLPDVSVSNPPLYPLEGLPPQP